MFELLQSTGYWDDYQHRTCATLSELEYRLREEWSHWCKKSSVLYFCTHGARDQMWLPKDTQPVELLTLKEWIARGGCHIHFGGCDTFSGGEVNLKDLMDSTWASAVSGYATETDWLNRIAPALSLELLFFGRLSRVNIVNKTKHRPERLRKIWQEI